MLCPQNKNNPPDKNHNIIVNAGSSYQDPSTESEATAMLFLSFTARLASATAFNFQSCTADTSTAIED